MHTRKFKLEISTLAIGDVDGEGSVKFFRFRLERPSS